MSVKIMPNSQPLITPFSWQHRVTKAFYYRITTHVAVLAMSLSFISGSIEVSSKLLTIVFTISSINSLDDFFSSLRAYLDKGSVNLKTYQDNTEKYSFIRFKTLKATAYCVTLGTSAIFYALASQASDVI